MGVRFSTESSNGRDFTTYRIKKINANIFTSSWLQFMIWGLYSSSYWWDENDEVLSPVGIIYVEIEWKIITCCLLISLCKVKSNLMAGVFYEALDFERVWSVTLHRPPITVEVLKLLFFFNPAGRQRWGGGNEKNIILSTLIL